MLDSERLKSWTTARSIYRAAFILGIGSDAKLSMQPRFYDKSSIAFGDSESLIFDDKELLALNKKMLIMPRITSLLRCPYSSVIKIFYLLKIWFYLRSSEQNLQKLKLLLGVGLEATATYMNLNSKCRKIIGSEHGRIDFYLNGLSYPLMSLLREDGKEWTISEASSLKSKPRVKMTIKNLELGILSCKNILNHHVSSALGEYDIVGYVPLMEKIGYCAKLTSTERPLLEI